jgi:hypothetical protein
MKLGRRLGMLLLGIWLIATGLLAFVHLPIPGLDLILAGLAIVAGLLLIFGR